MATEKVFDKEDFRLGNTKVSRKGGVDHGINYKHIIK